MVGIIEAGWEVGAWEVEICWDRETCDVGMSWEGPRLVMEVCQVCDGWEVIWEGAETEEDI